MDAYTAEDDFTPFVEWDRPDGDLEGHVLNGCLLVRYLGGGGQGEVWEAVDEFEDAHALKIQSIKRASDFLEIGVHQELSSLDHPHILKMRNWCYNTKHIFWLLELCPGGDLDRQVLNRGLDQVYVPRLFKQITQALQAVHNQGIYHLDLKLANLLVTDHWNVKLADFGLASRDRTVKGIRGTPGHIAPECFQACEEGYDAVAVDIYALGTILFAMLAKHEMFWGATRAVTWARNMAGEWNLECAIPPKARPLVRAMLAPDPRDRPTLEEILECEWLQDSPMETPPYEVWWAGPKPFMYGSTPSGIFSDQLLQYTPSQLDQASNPSVPAPIFSIDLGDILLHTPPEAVVTDEIIIPDLGVEHALRELDGPVQEDSASPLHMSPRSIAVKLKIRPRFQLRQRPAPVPTWRRRFSKAPRSRDKSEHPTKGPPARRCGAGIVIGDSKLKSVQLPRVDRFSRRPKTHV
ncbi:hypothetical protein IAT38_002001 [Cryptococcus sp. DSM 104549]